MLALAREAGFNDVQHVSRTLLADRCYFADRTDGLRPSPDNSESRDPDTGQGVSLHAASTVLACGEFTILESP